jgi:hypothetical protein
LNVTPYATYLGDLVNKNTTLKAGVDVLWKPSGKLNVIGTFNPDFGTVESDNLVINFSAIETVFTEKRPFFIENQRIFDTPDKTDPAFYTRRIGGPSDKDGRSSDIKAALKIIGSTNTVNYGIFAAQEAGDYGRSFYAGRMVFPAIFGSIGLLSTYVERPFLDRTAFVNTIDYNVDFSSTMKMKGMLTDSSVKAHEDNSSGFGLFDELRYADNNDLWSSILTIVHFDDTINLNDMGYMQRNGFDLMYLSAGYNQKNFSDDSSIASVSWPLSTTLERNADGVRFPAIISFMPIVKMRSGSQLSAQVTLNTEGYDDLISRHNGIVRLNQRWNTNISYSTPRRDSWSKSIQLQVFQEGIEKWAMGLQGNATWYPDEGLNVNFSLSPQWSRDWLKWVQGRQLGSFSRHQVTGGIAMNWFPSEGHEVWLKTQWYTVNAEAIQSYHIGANGRLAADNTSIKDFATNKFALQFRYRYEIAPMSDLWFCYSRGGNDYIDNPDQTTLGMLGESTKLRDSDQILLKLSYRFKIF